MNAPIIAAPKHDAPPTDDARYAALVARDPAVEGAFFYAVRTTGVYCRPTCRSRRPLRENVVFFDDRDAARSAGFRPCKRCRPDETPVDSRREAMLRACRLIEGADAMPTLAELARALEMSPSHLQRTFTRTIGVSPWNYGDAVRKQRLRTNLREGASVSAAIYDAGYGSASGAYDDAYASLGMSPATYRDGAENVAVTYAIVDSALGRVLVAATERGVAAVHLGDDDAELVAQLRADFPRAQCIREDDHLESATSAIVRYLGGRSAAPDLPLDVRATAFQRRVWSALRAVAPGTTTTYSELARAIGDQGATRAVARACATNSVALLIPCHRVVRKSGEMAGYRWGVERKRRLLALEAERPQ